MFERAGVPEGLVRTVHGGGAVGQALVESSAAKIFFTGSVEVGRRVGEECARRMKGSVLELGGKDPMIVCADANLPNAVSGCLWGGFANAGQTCSGIERVYVMEEVAERFIAGVVEGARGLRVGDPHGPAHRGGADGLARPARPGEGARGRRRVAPAPPCTAAERTGPTSARPCSPA